MILATAEASKTTLATSAGTVLADQLLRCRIKGSAARFLRHGMKSGQSLTPTFKRVTSTGLLQIAEGLLVTAESSLAEHQPRLQNPPR